MRRTFAATYVLLAGRLALEARAETARSRGLLARHRTPGALAG
ncbi:hypothetical protein [Agromyces sp. NPDC049794]